MKHLGTLIKDYPNMSQTETFVLSILVWIYFVREWLVFALLKVYLMVVLLDICYKFCLLHL